MDTIQYRTSVYTKHEASSYHIWPISWLMHPVKGRDSNLPPPENIMMFNVSNFDINITNLNMSDWSLPDKAHHASEQCSNLLEFFLPYYLPIVILVGLVGNLLSCLVFLNSRLKTRSSSYYLAALSMADFGFLLSISFVWLDNNFGIEVYNVNGWCQGLVYVSSVCSFLSVWLIVSFTVERFIAVQYPLHRPMMCTVHRAKTVVSVLTGIAVLLHTYCFVAVGMKVDEVGQESCDLRDGYDEVMRVINIVDSLLTLIVPLFLITIMNTMIMKNLLRFGQRLERSNSTHGNRRNIFTLPWLGRSSIANVSMQHSVGSQTQEAVPAKRRSDTNMRGLSMNSSQNSITTRTQRNITKMLLLISSVFVLLNLPSYIMRLYSLWHQWTPSLWCMQQLCMLLYYTNFSINFLLYSMYGTSFRRCLWQLLLSKLRTMTNSVCPNAY